MNHKKNSRHVPPASRARLAGAATLAALLSACGGGGGGGGSGSSASVVASATSVTAAATYADNAPTRSFTVELLDPPDDGVYVDIRHDTDGVQQVDFTETAPGLADFTVSFRPPVDVEVGTVTDTITLTVCEDTRCDREVRGSPIRVTATYTVTSPTSATISTTAVSAEVQPVAIAVTVSTYVPDAVACASSTFASLTPEAAGAEPCSP